MLATSHWYSSQLGEWGVFLAATVTAAVVCWLMVRWHSGAPGAVRAFVIAHVILAAFLGAVIWLYVQ